MIPVAPESTVRVDLARSGMSDRTALGRGAERAFSLDEHTRESLESDLPGSFLPGPEGPKCDWPLQWLRVLGGSRTRSTRAASCPQPLTSRDDLRKNSTQPLTSLSAAAVAGHGSPLVALSNYGVRHELSRTAGCLAAASSVPPLPMRSHLLFARHRTPLTKAYLSSSFAQKATKKQHVAQWELDSPSDLQAGRFGFPGRNGVVGWCNRRHSPESCHFSFGRFLRSMHGRTRSHVSSHMGPTLIFQSAASPVRWAGPYSTVNEVLGAAVASRDRRSGAGAVEQAPCRRLRSFKGGGP